MGASFVVLKQYVLRKLEEPEPVEADEDAGEYDEDAGEYDDDADGGRLRRRSDRRRGRGRPDEDGTDEAESHGATPTGDHPAGARRRQPER